MKHFITIAGTVLITIATVIACVGSYKAHRQSMLLRPAPQGEVVEIYTPITYVEVAPEIDETYEEVQKQTATEIFVPTDIPMLRDNTFVNLTYEEQNFLLDVAMAEAEGEDSVGKALVMITVLNRSEYFSAPIGEIIYAPNQFAVGRMGIQPIENCYEALGMVVDGWNETWIEGDWDKTKKILWFSADGYPAYGEPMFQYGGHYFSGVAF